MMTSVFFHIGIHPKQRALLLKEILHHLREGPKDLLFEDEATNGSNTGEEEDFNEIDQLFLVQGTGLTTSS